MITLCTYVHAHVTDDALSLRCLQQLCKNLESMKESITFKKVVCTAISPVRKGGMEGGREGGREGWREGGREGGREKSLTEVGLARSIIWEAYVISSSGPRRYKAPFSFAFLIPCVYCIRVQGEKGHAISLILSGRVMLNEWSDMAGEEPGMRLHKC